MAKYGQFEAYEPATDVGPDAFRFTLANGDQKLFSGPKALDLKSRLDAYDSARPRTAEAPASPGVTPVKSDATATETIKVNSPVKTEQLMLPPEDRAVVLNEINTGIKLDEQGRPYREVAGSAGTSQAQLQAKVPTGVATPTAQSETVTGGFAPDTEYLADQTILSDVERNAMEQQRGAELKAEEAGRQVAQEQFVAATAHRDEQEKLLAQLQAQMQQASATRDQALKDYTGSQVDPARIFHGGARPLLGLMAALSSGAGAYGAAINRTENFAMKAVDTAIARDIAAQEADIRIKKDGSDTALADLMRRGMDLKQAKGTLESIQSDWAKQKLMLARGASQNEAINAKWDATIAGFDRKESQRVQDYMRDAEGKITRAQQAQIVYPRAGSAGGRQYLTPEQATELAGRKTTLEGGIASTGKTIHEVETDKGAGANQPRKAKALAGIEASKAALLKVKEKWQKMGKPGVFATGYFGSDESQQLAADVDSLAPGLGRGLEGNAPNESTMKAIREGILSADPTKIGSNIDAYLERLEEQKQSLINAPGDLPDERQPQ